MDNPPQYEQTNLMQIRDFVWFFERKRGVFQTCNNEVVLDVGCGPGDLTVKMFMTYFPSGTKMIGCDTCNTMIKYAKQYHFCENLEFKYLRIDVPNINWDEWKEKSFTKIISNFCFHWIGSRRGAARNMYRLLKPNGELYLLFMAPHKLMECFNAVALKSNFDDFTQYFRDYVEIEDPIHELNEVLKDAGFSRVSIEKHPRTFSWTSEELAMRWINSMDPYVNDIPKYEQPRYEKVLKQLLLKENVFTVEKSSGWITMEYELIDVYAKK